MISQELIDYLDKQFPDKSPDLKDSERQIWIKAGQASVVSHLKMILNDNDQNILKQTIINTRLTNKEK
tara:strand:+ start:402 stop:605 length:204 start_codon:yes stop_codon:yes gene_type:complete